MDERSGLVREGAGFGGIGSMLRTAGEDAGFCEPEEKARGEKTGVVFNWMCDELRLCISFEEHGVPKPWASMTMPKIKMQPDTVQ